MNTTLPGRPSPTQVEVLSLITTDREDVLMFLKFSNRRKALAGKTGNRVFCRYPPNKFDQKMMDSFPPNKFGG